MLTGDSFGDPEPWCWGVWIPRGFVSGYRWWRTLHL